MILRLYRKNPINMQTMLDTINEWCDIRKMKINMSKTKVMEVRKKGIERSLAKFYLGDKLLKKCNDYKYLGVYFDEYLNFNKNIETLSNSGQRALGALIAKYKSLNEMGFDTYSKCFNSYICPILDYGAEIWGYCNSNKSESVQNKAIRVFLGVHKFASIDFLNGDMGWYPGKIRKKLSMLRFWNRLINMEDNRLTKQIFEDEYLNNGFWCTKIYEILKEIDSGQVYENKTTCDIKICENKLQENYVKLWEKQILKKPKLRSYIKWKIGFKTEYYVKLNLPRNQRSILAQFRSGTLPLKIETGRFCGLKPEERLCQFCILPCDPCIESETHFLLECNCYHLNRSQFFKNVNINLSLDKDLIIKTIFDNHSRKLARFISTILEIRRENEYKISA